MKNLIIILIALCFSCSPEAKRSPTVYYKYTVKLIHCSIPTRDKIVEVVNSDEPYVSIRTYKLAVPELYVEGEYYLNYCDYEILKKEIQK